MRKVATILLLLVNYGLNAQQNSFNTKNNSAHPTETTDPAILAFKLTRSCNSEKEKVKAIFYWITENISYFRPKPFSYPFKASSTQLAEDDDDGLPLPELNERVARKVLKDKTAVCEGYARLFKILCQYAGVKAEIITGYARANQRTPGNKFISNHSWNAVFFDEQWHLLDATWASGHLLSSTGEFVRQYNSFYFLTDPAEFINDHYPDDSRWSLLYETPAINEFKHYPFRQRSFIKYPINSFSPAKGIIDVNLGDTVRLELETRSLINPNTIAPDSLWENIILLDKPAYAFVKPDMPVNGNRVYYNFPVQSENIQWLYVMYNDDAILRYRINVKKNN